MNHLYIWFQRVDMPKGFPYIDDILLKSKFYPKRPQTSHIGDEKWQLFNHYANDGFPPNDEFSFPTELYLVVTKKKYKEVSFDYLDYKHHFVKLVSERFLFFLKENGLDESYYETAALNIIDLKGELITKDKYYALRFGKFDDALFNFPEETRKRAAGLRGEFLYPDLQLKSEIGNKNIFVLFGQCYSDCLILNEKTKSEVIRRFRSPEIYNIADYPYIFNNQHKMELLPIDNEFKVKI